jgi:hypothetical protein
LLPLSRESSDFSDVIGVSEVSATNCWLSARKKRLPSADIADANSETLPKEIRSARPAESFSQIDNKAGTNPGDISSSP